VFQHYLYGTAAVCGAGGDQGLLNQFFSDWARQDISRRLPFIYNVVSQQFYTYQPAFKQCVLRNSMFAVCPSVLSLLQKPVPVSMCYGNSVRDCSVILPGFNVLFLPKPFFSQPMVSVKGFLMLLAGSDRKVNL